MFSLFTATRWHCRLKGKHLFLFRELGGRWKTLKNCTATLKFFLGLRDARKAFPFNWQASSFDRSERDVCLVMIMKSSKGFGICKYVRAIQSCCFALLLPLGCDVVSELRER